MNQKPSRTVIDYLQIPLAITSFVFFRLVRIFMRGLVGFFNRMKRGKPVSWRVVSAEMVGKALALPVFMTKAPRWNPHAILGMAGPIDVKSKIVVDVEQANASAEIWGLSIQPTGQGAEQRISSASGVAVTDGSIALPAGQYMLVMRYYGHGAKVSLPTIRVDDNTQIDALRIDSENNKFYSALLQRKNVFYVLLNFYVYSLLRFQDILPISFVTKEYLPAGDAGMQYKFAAVRRGSALRIITQPQLLTSYAVYFTRYNLASFPVVSHEIKTDEIIIGESEENGHYLIRLLPKNGMSQINSDIGKLLTVTEVVPQGGERSVA